MSVEPATIVTPESTAAGELPLLIGPGPTMPETLMLIGAPDASEPVAARP